MKYNLIIFALFVLLVLPLHARAESHAEHGSAATHDHHAAADTMMDARSIALGEVTEEGIKATAYLNDVGAVMAREGKKENYHFMVMLVDTATAAQVDKGNTALRITAPGLQQAGEPVVLMGMGGHFGADISLLAKGEYKFEVGSKLADGKKRQFLFKYTVK